MSYEATMDGEMLRLASNVQTLVRGASQGTMAKLGWQRLKELRAFFEAENDILTQAANQVMVLNRSSLSIETLKGLGLERLRELGATAGAPVDPYEGYSINAIIEETLKAK
jgi:hypothetical protein